MSARARILDRLATAQPKAPREQEYPRCAEPSVEGDLLARFMSRARRLASDVASAETDADVPVVVARYLATHALPPRAVCWPDIASLPWREAGVEVEIRPAAATDAVGITGVFAAIAETGTLMLLSGPRTPATVSLLPETHIAIVRRHQIVPTMERAWVRLRAETGNMPRAVNFVSGPSRTADVEQTITLGAHGPRRVLIVAVG